MSTSYPGRDFHAGDFHGTVSLPHAHVLPVYELVPLASPNLRVELCTESGATANISTSSRNIGIGRRYTGGVLKLGVPAPGGAHNPNQGWFFAPVCSTQNVGATYPSSATQTPDDQLYSLHSAAHDHLAMGASATVGEQTVNNIVGDSIQSLLRFSTWKIVRRAIADTGAVASIFVNVNMCRERLDERLFNGVLTVLSEHDTQQQQVVPGGKVGLTDVQGGYHHMSSGQESGSYAEELAAGFYDVRHCFVCVQVGQWAKDEKIKRSLRETITIPADFPMGAPLGHGNNNFRIVSAMHEPFLCLNSMNSTLAASVLPPQQESPPSFFFFSFIRGKSAKTGADGFHIVPNQQQQQQQTRYKKHTIHQDTPRFCVSIPEPTSTFDYVPAELQSVNSSSSSGFKFHQLFRLVPASALLPDNARFGMWACGGYYFLVEADSWSRSSNVLELNCLMLRSGHSSHASLSPGETLAEKAGGSQAVGFALVMGKFGDALEKYEKSRGSLTCCMFRVASADGAEQNQQQGQATAAAAAKLNGPASFTPDQLSYISRVLAPGASITIAPVGNNSSSNNNNKNNSDDDDFDDLETPRSHLRLAAELVVAEDKLSSDKTVTQHLLGVAARTRIAVAGFRPAADREPSQNFEIIRGYSSLEPTSAHSVLAHQTGVVALAPQNPAFATIPYPAAYEKRVALREAVNAVVLSADSIFCHAKQKKLRTDFGCDFVPCHAPAETTNSGDAHNTADQSYDERDNFAFRFGSESLYRFEVLPCTFEQEDSSSNNNSVVARIICIRDGTALTIDPVSRAALFAPVIPDGGSGAALQHFTITQSAPQCVSAAEEQQHRRCQRPGCRLLATSGNSNYCCENCAELHGIFVERSKTRSRGLEAADEQRDIEFTGGGDHNPDIVLACFIDQMPDKHLRPWTRQNLQHGNGCGARCLNLLPRHGDQIEISSALWPGLRVSVVAAGAKVPTGSAVVLAPPDGSTHQRFVLHQEGSEYRSSSDTGLLVEHTRLRLGDRFPIGAGNNNERGVQALETSWAPGKWSAVFDPVFVESSNSNNNGEPTQLFFRILFVGSDSAFGTPRPRLVFAVQHDGPTSSDIRLYTVPVGAGMHINDGRLGEGGRRDVEEMVKKCGGGRFSFLFSIQRYRNMRSAALALTGAELFDVEMDRRRKKVATSKLYESANLQTLEELVEDREPLTDLTAAAVDSMRALLEKSPLLKDIAARALAAFSAPPSPVAPSSNNSSSGSGNSVSWHPGLWAHSSMDSLMRAWGHPAAPAFAELQRKLSGYESKAPKMRAALPIECSGTTTLLLSKALRCPPARVPALRETDLDGYGDDGHLLPPSAAAVVRSSATPNRFLVDHLCALYHRCADDSVRAAFHIALYVLADLDSSVPLRRLLKHLFSEQRANCSLSSWAIAVNAVIVQAGQAVSRRVAAASRAVPPMPGRTAAEAERLAIAERLVILTLQAFNKLKTQAFLSVFLPAVEKSVSGGARAVRMHGVHWWLAALRHRHGCGVEMAYDPRERIAAGAPFRGVANVGELCERMEKEKDEEDGELFQVFDRVAGDAYSKFVRALAPATLEAQLTEMLIVRPPPEAAGYSRLAAVVTGGMEMERVTVEFLNTLHIVFR